MVPPPVSDPDPRAALDEAQCIEISGEDARAFVQAQFSGDVRALLPGHWQWNAWLDHRGVVRALMHLADAGDGRLLALLRGGDAQSLCADLRRYVLRARVRIEVLQGRLLSIGAALPMHQLGVEADALGFGCGERSVWIETVRRARDAERERAFRLAEIGEGWPSLPADGEGEFLPPALGLEHLGAVSFDKGCYPGQEIAARLHYRGGHKRRLCHVWNSSPMQAGEVLPTASGRDAVLVGTQADAGWHALAVMDEPKTVESGDLRNELRVIRRFEP